MPSIWQRNIFENLELPRKNEGPALVTVVCGSESDMIYWQRHFANRCGDVFRKDGDTLIVSVCEPLPRGNFLGSLNAWCETKAAISAKGKQLPCIGLMSMVLGEGKRLSPFTQALGNRKAAFLTPMRLQNAMYMRSADLSNLYTNTWLHHLSGNGFRGLVIKWGDEAIIPGLVWRPGQNDYSDVDAVRFVWQTEITEQLAREKDWVLVDSRTELMKFQYSRQDAASLRMRVSGSSGESCAAAVNLGSLAVTYEFMNIALEVLRDDVLDASRRWADWDPYVWIALFCEDESQWRAEAAHEDRIGKNGIRDLEIRYPNFYFKVAQLRSDLESKKGRPLRVAAIDFGDAFWVDMGLHTTLRRTLESLTSDSEIGAATRELFRIPHARDRNGNTIVRSVVPRSASIRDSVIVDSVITDQDSVVHNGVVVAGRHRKLLIPHGGSALFCAADDLVFTGRHGIAFLSSGSRMTVPEGGRHTTLLLPEGPTDMVSNEAILDYGGETYSQPILGNRLSYKEAGRIMSKIDGQELENRWLEIWDNWLT